jgi:uncharacterized membrane protein required for colicin V production
VDLNVVDVAIVGIVALTTLLGYRSGLITGVLGLLGAGIAIGLLILAAPAAADALAEVDPLVRTVIVLVAVALAFGLGESIGGALARAARRRMGRGVLSALDQVGGAVLGLAQGVFVVWLVGGLVTATPVPAIAAEARSSVLLQEVDERLPSPVGVIAELGHALETTLLPDVFIGGAPPAAPPVGGPSQDAADRIAASARASVVRVEAVACGRLLSGTGWAIGPHHYVTNAHVVAGATSVELSRDGRFDRYDAVVVAFDPRLDLALLYAPDLPSAPLALADDRPARGDPAAALGHTGGGGLRVIPAVVSRTMTALGRDIYGRGGVTRDVVEVRAGVSPGDSGGPLVLADGTVGGVTFSESREDTAIGYAVAPDAVAEAVDPALGAVDDVDVGPCAA